MKNEIRTDIASINSKIDYINSVLNALKTGNGKFKEKKTRYEETNAKIIKNVDLLNVVHDVTM